MRHAESAPPVSPIHPANGRRTSSDDGLPNTAEALVVVIVRDTLPLPFRGFCEKLQLVPRGNPEQLNVTAPVNPYMSETCRLIGPVELPFTALAVFENDWREKSGATMVNVML